MFFKDKNTLNIIYFLPVIIGPFFLNLGMSILYLVSVIFLLTHSRKINFLEIYNDFFFRLLLLFFIYININSLISFYILKTLDVNLLIKTLLYNKILLLFIFLFYILKKMSFFSFEKCLYFAAFFSLLLISDLIYQKIFGHDIFGHKTFYRRLSGPYGEELVPGFILLFSGLLGTMYTIKKFLNNEKKILSNFLIILFFFVIFLTGERMVFLLTLLFLAVLFLLHKQYRFKNFVNIFCIILLCFSTILFDKDLNKKYKRFSMQLGLEDQIVEKIFTSDNQGIEKQNDPNLFLHFVHFKSGLETWKKNPLIGSGFGNFRFVCKDNKNISIAGRCNTHPHNLYIEILAEIGLLGLILFLSILAYFLWFNLNFIFKICFKNKRKIKINEYIFIILFILVFIQVWPIKTSGRLFSYFNGTVFWINIFVCYIYHLNIKKKWGA